MTYSISMSILYAFWLSSFCYGSFFFDKFVSYPAHIIIAVLYIFIICSYTLNFLTLQHMIEKVKAQHTGARIYDIDLPLIKAAASGMLINSIFLFFFNFAVYD